MPAIRTVAVVGVGLIGGSFALALRRIGYQGRIVGVSSPPTLARARELGVIDAGLPMAEALRDADLVYMAQPVPVIMEQLQAVRAHVGGHALVTDAGSTKRSIVGRARELFTGGPDFLGGHPMAGKEGRGVGIADAALFRGATYVLVPAGTVLPGSAVCREFLGWLDAMECRTRVMAADEHDRIVGWTSHLPQLVSTALAGAIAGELTEREDLSVAGDGLRDMTRLASSPYGVWAGILQTNREPIDRALRSVIGELESLRAALRGDGASGHFRRGSAFRERLRSAGANPGTENLSCR